jgi:outer membrane receptor for ferrienterochelin and colicins
VCIINHQLSSHARFASIVIILLCLTPATARSQSAAPQDPDALSIEQLLEVELTSTASKFSQQITHAPASVTVITAEQIRQYGYRTFGEILSSVRGFYTTYDRNYTYVGVRGFARPGDYNTRVLLMIDGHRLNEPVYDMAPMGTDFPLDVSLIDRVEVIRGPGSSLYGTSAFFGVINVLTKNGSSLSGTRVDASIGSLDTQRATVSVGQVFNNGNELLIAGSGYRSGGNARLYFPEYDVPGISDGVVTDADSDRSAGLTASASVGRLRVSGSFIDRVKQIPTGAFTTVFGDRRTRSDDRRAYIDAVSTGSFAKGWTAVLRGALDYYRYSGAYAYDYGADGVVVQDDGSDSLQVSGEVTLNRRSRAHQLTMGTEIRRTLHNHQYVSDWVNGSLLDESHPATVLGLYAQDEITLRRWLLFNAGVRLDHHDAFGSSVNPRAGLVFLPRPTTALKVLHGRAFRAPNSYEAYYYDATGRYDFTLKPETIATTEVVWEEYIGSRLRTAVSAFHYDVERLISQKSLDSVDAASASELYFTNDGRTAANGVEAEVETRWTNGLVVSGDYSHVRATDAATGLRLSNSPHHLANLRVAFPVRPLSSTVGVEVRGVGERRNLSGDEVHGFVLGNVTGRRTLTKKLELEFGVYNVLDSRYADPGAEEHLQSAITQDGRTARVRIVARF